MRTPRTFLAGSTILLLLSASAQVQIDRSIELSGAAQDRRVEDLADPIAGGNALNTRSARNAGHIYGVAAGTNTLVVSLTPGITATQPGTQVHLKIPNGNTGAVTLALAGTPTYPVVKHGGDPLVAGDLVAGSVVLLLFDGAAFHLMTPATSPVFNCPPGSVAVNDEYCIEVNERPSVEFPDAANICGAANGHLCSWGQWYAACTDSVALGLQGMTGNWEWTNNSANADQSVRVVGPSSCTQASVGPILGTPRYFRCCFRR